MYVSYQSRPQDQARRLTPSFPRHLRICGGRTVSLGLELSDAIRGSFWCDELTVLVDLNVSVVAGPGKPAKGRIGGQSGSALRK